MSRDSLAGARNVLNVLLCLAVAVAALGFAEDVRSTFDYGGVDLRSRVVGARLMLEDLDPYYFRWNESYADTLLDPIDNRENEVSRVTVPPTVLMLHAPLAGLPYSTQRTAWLFVQWLLLLASVFLFSRCGESAEEAKAVWIIGLFFAATPIWRFHVERGQIYVLFVFLVALSFWLSRRSWGYAPLLAGLALGALVSMRPTFAAMCLPMLFFRSWKLLAGLAVGLLVLLLLSAAIFGIPVWKSYAKAMRLHEGASLLRTQTDRFDYDYGRVEGMENLQEFMAFPDINTSVQSLLYRAFGVELRSGALALMLGAVLLLSAAYFLLSRGREVPLRVVLLAGSVLVLLCEYLIPGRKAYYGNILWLVPLSLLALDAGALLSLPRWRLQVAMFLLLAGVYFNAAIYWRQFDAALGEGMVMLFFLWTCASLIQASPARNGREGLSPETEAAA